VVPSEKKEIFWIFNFVSEQQQDRFHRLFAAIDVVAQEEVVRVRGVTAFFEVPYLSKGIKVEEKKRFFEEYKPMG
jgi:hypothetical protein